MADVASIGYAEAENASWDEVRLAAVPKGKPQLSAHIPLGLPEASDLLICDCAFNAWKLPVPPDMKTGDARTAEIRESLRVGLVSVALGEAPFVPEFRQTRWTRRAGGYPIVRGELDAQRRHYAFDYCTDPRTGELYIRGTVRNAGPEPLDAVIRLKRSEPLEREACDYHYFTFRWDAERWGAGEATEPPAVVESDFDETAVNDRWSLGGDAFCPKRFICGAPYFIHPAMRIKGGGGCLRFSAHLQPGESRSFTVAAGFAEGHIGQPASFDDICDAAVRFWDARLPATADFGDARENDVFRCLQICNLQLLLNPWKDPASPYLQPCQGGTSERFYVWVWEAMFSLRPMARLGHFAEVRKVLEFILRLQDGGCPPEGAFTTLSGAIGTTGPRWANTTGSALMLATEYIECSGDEDFERRHLNDLIRAAKWILGETRATRRLRPDGTREIGYGLMPGCVVNDGDRGIFFATTDSYSYAGVRALADCLVRKGHPEGARLAAECARYKEDLDRTISEVQRDDGFIPRLVGSDAGGSFEFRNIPGAFGLIYSGAIDPATDARMARMVRLWEREHARGPFLEPFDAGISYIGNCESGLARYHALRGEWKRAYLARQSFMNYAMTRDLHVTAERYSEVDDGFTPWQPNASNNGRGLDMMAGRFLIDGGTRIVLLGGFAPFEAGDLSIDGLHTRFGACSVSRRSGVLRAAWERPLPPGLLVVVPTHHGFKPDAGLAPVAEGVWEVAEPITAICGTVS